MEKALSQEEYRRLLRWQRRMLSLFVGMWVYILGVISVHLLIRPAHWIVNLAFIPVLGFLLGGVMLQFSIRCPNCGYRIGRQSRLVVPDHCRSCDIALRSPEW